MTSISVGFEVRRQLNSMRALGNYKSVDDLLQHLLKEYRLNQISRDSDALQRSLESLNDVDVDGLVAKLGLSPF
jgi:Arc/MetJ-type ribon-helix-helix transcriptional regulator